MIVFANFHRLFGDTSPLFAERKGAEIRIASIRDFGITPNILPEHCTPDHGVLRITPIPDRHVFYQWLGFIQAEAVSVEAGDLNVFVPDHIIRTGMQSNWNSIAPDLDKLMPEELFDSLERAALKVFTAQPTQGTSTDEQWLRGHQEQTTLAAMKQAGIKDPLAHWDAYDAQRERERFAHLEREDQAISDFMGSEPEPVSDSPYRETTGDF